MTTYVESKVSRVFPFFLMVLFIVSVVAATVASA